MGAGERGDLGYFGGGGGGWRRRESPRGGRCRGGRLGASRVSPGGAAPPEPRRRIGPVGGGTPFFVSRLGEPGGSRTGRRWSRCRQVVRYGGKQRGHAAGALASGGGGDAAASAGGVFGMWADAAWTCAM